MKEPADLLGPNGPIEPALFPGVDSNVLEARLQAYLDVAYADSRVVAAPAEMQDPMAEAFALYKAFLAVYTRMLNEPLTVNIAEKGSHGYSTKQLEGIKALADFYLAAFLALVPTGTSVAVPIGSRSVATRFTW